MSAETEQKSHPKSIWYWVGSERLWYLPYASTPLRLKKGCWQFNGGAGTQDVVLDKSAHILFYGADEQTGALPLSFLAECAEYGVGITVHRNHVAAPLMFYRQNSHDRNDLLTRQILAREDAKKRAYIARTQVKWQWHQREWLGPCTGPASKLAACRSTAEARQIEARTARAYWEVYYRKLGLAIGRRDTHPVNTALEALSHFLHGITLRWVVSHGLSPAHGFLHTDPAYTALVYDLMETTRWITEKAVFDEYQAGGESTLTERATKRFRAMLDEPIQSEPTRQQVYRKSLIQGGVIALRHYLEGRMRRYLPPIEETAQSRGRKRKTSYQLPGEIWKSKI